MRKIQPDRNLSVNKNIVPLVVTTIIIFITLVIFTSYQHNLYLNLFENILRNIETESKKMRINSEMMEVARSRTRITSQIIDTDDIFQQDELSIKLDSFANQFSILRDELLRSPLTDDEKNILNTHNDIVGVILPAQRSAVELAMFPASSDDKRAEELLYGTVLPGQEKLIRSFSHLISIEQQHISEFTEQSLESITDMKRGSAILITTVVIVSLLLSTFEL